VQQFFRPAIVDPLRDQGAGQGRLGDRNNAGGLSKARQMSSRPTDPGHPQAWCQAFRGGR